MSGNEIFRSSLSSAGSGIVEAPAPTRSMSDEKMRVLIPISLPVTSIDALMFARNMSREKPISVTLLNIIALNIACDSRLYDEVALENESALAEIGRRFFDPETEVTARVRVGNPSEQIAAEADSNLTDLIVMPAPDNTRRRWFSEGTVKGVVRLTSCPTLVLPRVWYCGPERPCATRSAEESTGHWFAPVHA
jgi:nucleotide-binding universal stress UspA family protein